MTKEVKVKSNLKQFTKRMTKREKEQVPFAAQQAFKQTTFMMRKYFTDKTFPKAFKTGNARNFAKGILRMDLKRVLSSYM